VRSSLQVGIWLDDADDLIIRRLAVHRQFRGVRVPHADLADLDRRLPRLVGEGESGAGKRKGKGGLATSADKAASIRRPALEPRSGGYPTFENRRLEAP
jgi:hypothetical protein